MAIQSKEPLFWYKTRPQQEEVGGTTSSILGHDKVLVNNRVAIKTTMSQWRTDVLCIVQKQNTKHGRAKRLGNTRSRLPYSWSANQITACSVSVTFRSKRLVFGWNKLQKGRIV